MNPSHNPLVIRATDLRYLDVCTRRLWLDRHGDSDLRDELVPISSVRLAAGIRHEQIVQAATVQHIEHTAIQSWADGVRLTGELMRQGVPVIINGYLEAAIQIDGLARPLTIRGRVDRLVRLDPHSLPRHIAAGAPLTEGRNRQPIVYTPVEIKAYQDVGPSDQVQLDCYVWLLTQMQGIEPPTAELWLGRSDDHTPREQVQHEYDELRLESALHEISRLADSDAPEPPAFIKPHCKECPWRAACPESPGARFDVSLLSGIRKDTCEALRQAGIVTLDQIAVMEPPDLRRYKGIKTTAEGYLAHARAWVERRPIWHGALPDVCKSRGYLFDIETRQDTGDVWSLGWSRSGGDVEVILVSPGEKPRRSVLSGGQKVLYVPDSEGVWRAFADAVSGSDEPIFHWTGFDAGVMHRFAPGEVWDRLEHRLHDLHHSFTHAVKFPIENSSLKTVAVYLGYRWRAYEAWWQAYADYQMWLDTGDERALARACAYQGDDVIAMRVVWDWLMRHAP